ncbi:hypothetical protein [Raineyella fluvialis]|uniref:Uncharacterized protein n=1 Tax=Raineyella fluvialis TaxID=2662261 RepID=A0A5Q2FJ15_9ACTN|nr:hypothetical protein [Raineyella fluvialis]QGF24645.1 hypothetical protein Rai3103_14515 [Raineyella fluvialis]
MTEWLHVLVHAVVVVLCALLAVGPGGRVVTAVFRRVDRSEAPSRPRVTRSGEGDHPEDQGPATVEEAAAVLRGGLWIGRLERLAVFATLAAGYPNGLAVAVAVKALARYPELRSTTGAAAERFIIGTFVSVLWAAGWAGLARWILTLW